VNNEHGHPEGDDVPLGVKFVICFLLTDAARRAAELLLVPLEGNSPPIFVLILWIITNLLLAALLGLRTKAGRFWTQAMTLVHLFYLAHTLAVENPYLWLFMDLGSRLKVLTTIFIDGLIFAYLCGRSARDHLVN
jgi:hypothetical protein